MNNYKELLKEFPKEREENLRSIERYSMFEVMFYRPVLWYHTLRVNFILNELLKVAEGKLSSLDPEKARILALVHDDAEMVTGDIQLGHKQQMSKEELQAVVTNEEDAINKLSRIYPKEIAGYNYKDLLLSILNKDTIEAQLVSYADKLDAYCESLHEVFGGNISALRAVINYIGVLKDFEEKYPNLKPIFDTKDSFLSTINFYTDMFKIHKDNYAHLGRPHSPETIYKETEFVIYNKWKKLVLDNLGKEGIDILINKTENLD